MITRAIATKDGREVHIEDAEPRKPHAGLLGLPHEKCTLWPVFGEKRRPYFRHSPGSICRARGGEGPLHEETKEQWAEYLRRMADNDPIPGPLLLLWVCPSPSCEVKHLIELFDEVIYQDSDHGGRTLGKVEILTEERYTAPSGAYCRPDIQIVLNAKTTAFIEIRHSNLGKSKEVAAESGVPVFVVQASHGAQPLNNPDARLSDLYDMSDDIRDEFRSMEDAQRSWEDSLPTGDWGMSQDGPNVRVYGETEMQVPWPNIEGVLPIAHEAHNYGCPLSPSLG